MGDDQYYVDNFNDFVGEFGFQGIDTVNASISYTLGFTLENLFLQNGAGWINGAGNEGNNKLYGNDGNNVLKGHGGDDVLVGRGGKDTMYGGEGNDYYIIDSTDDIVWEFSNEGFDDFIWTSASYHMSNNVERMMLNETGGAINGYGNGQDNVIFGNEFDNIIGGQGGNDSLWGYGGNDKLIGGLGNDHLGGGNGNDTFKFSVNFGADTIADFKANGDADVIEIDAQLFANFDAIQAHLTQNGDDAVITWSAGHTITLQDVNAASLQASDFNFV
jgi:Ca2+-binding RTX toxin-like protein